MEKNGIIAAPEVEGVGDLYGIWSRHFVGTREDFYEFMTTPSAGRQEFLNLCADSAVNVSGGSVAQVVLRHQS